MKRIPYSAATSCPRGSAVMIVIRSAAISRRRNNSGRTPCPMLPKPTMTRRPGKAACFLSSMTLRLNGTPEPLTSSIGERITSAGIWANLRPLMWRSGRMRNVVTALVVGVLLAAGPALAQAKNGKGGGYEHLNPFSEAYDRIRQDAVEPVGEGKLIGAAIAGMLSGLDVRSAYINEAAYRAMQTPANDDEASLGLVVTIENGQLKVIA